MRSLHPRALTLALLFAFHVSSLFAASTPPATKPHVLFIAFDDLNDWVLGARAGVKAPNLDRLMARGVTFTNAHCAAPSCHPSRLAMMTGVRPSTSGIDRNVYSRPEASWRTGPAAGSGALARAVVLSQHFRDNGWRAIGAGKIFHGLQWIDGSENEPSAWDDYYPSALDQIPTQIRPHDLVPDSESGIIGERPLGGGIDRRGQVFGAHPIQAPTEKMSDALVADWAIGQIKKQPAAGTPPLFLAVGFFRPHIPWEVPQKYFDLYPLDKIELPPDVPGDLDDTKDHDRVSWHEWVLANDAKFQMWRRLVQGYLASITFADEQLGRVLDALDASPLAKNTVVVAWSDHGMHLGEKKNWEKFTLWEKSTRVPLIVAGPGVAKPGSRVSQPASLIDVYPTLCELAGLPIPAQCEGTSLLPQLRDPATPREVPAITTQTQGKQSGHTVRDERWRYIRYYDGFEELYDHSVDPGELKNLAADPAYAAEKKRLLGWLEKVRAPLAGHPASKQVAPKKQKAAK